MNNITGNTVSFIRSYLHLHISLYSSQGNISKPVALHNGVLVYEIPTKSEPKGSVASMMLVTCQ